MSSKEEILGKLCGLTFDNNTHLIQTHFEYVIKAMQEYATQSTQALREEMDELKKVKKMYEGLYVEKDELCKSLEQEKQTMMAEYSDAMSNGVSQIQRLERDNEMLKTESRLRYERNNDLEESLEISNEQRQLFKERSENYEKIIAKIKELESDDWTSANEFISIMAQQDELLKQTHIQLTASEARVKELVEVMQEIVKDDSQEVPNWVISKLQTPLSGTKQ